MDELISRQDAIDVIDKEQKEIDVSDVSAMYAYSKCKTIIKQLPSAPPKTGRWKNIVDGFEYTWGTCDWCRARIPMAYKYYEYCPHCGTKMEVAT